MHTKIDLCAERGWVWTDPNVLASTFTLISKRGALVVFGMLRRRVVVGDREYGGFLFVLRVRPAAAERRRRQR